MRKILAAAAIIGLAAGAALAASHMRSGHAGHGAAGPDSASTTAYLAAAARMHEGMGIALSGDADVDFARGMIPHHQGAIDMARIVIEHGADPELRRLAEEIVAAQEAEIEFLRDWLAARDR